MLCFSHSSYHQKAALHRSLRTLDQKSPWRVPQHEASGAQKATVLSEEVHQLLNSAKMKTFDDQKRTELVFRHVTMFFIVFVCLVFFPSVFSLTWMIPKCKWVFWNCAIFDVVLRHKMQLQGLIVETGKGYLAPNMPHGSGDCIPRKLPNQTHPSLDPDPTKFPTYLFPQSRKLHTHIMIPGRDRSEGHPALRTYSSSKETPMIASVPLHCWKRSLLVLRYQSRTQ